MVSLYTLYRWWTWGPERWNNSHSHIACKYGVKIQTQGTLILFILLMQWEKKTRTWIITKKQHWTYLRSIPHLRSDYYHKLPVTEWYIDKINLPLTVSESRSLSPGSHRPVRAGLLVAHLSLCPHMQNRWERALRCLVEGRLSHSWRLHPHDPGISQRPHLPISSHWC